MVDFHLSGRLWHHRDFMRLWFSDTVSLFGNQFTNLALSALAVKSFNAGAIEMGTLNALGILAFPTLGLFVGVWADRFQKKRIMTICNFGRMATLGTIPVAFVFGALTLYQLYAVALVNGIFTVFFDVSYQSYLPLLIDRSDLVEGNSKLQTSASGAQIVGPSIAGLVYDIIGGAYSIGIDAIGYLTSALSLVSIRKNEPKPQRDPSKEPNFFSEMREGIQVVFGNPILKRIAACTATSNLGTSIAGAVIYIFFLDTLNLSVFVVGLIGSVGSIGFFIGVLLTGRLTKKLGLGASLAVSIGAEGIGLISPLAIYGYPFLVLSLASFIGGLVLPTYNINQISLRQAITPDHLQGRMNATIRTLVWGTIPLGAIIGGIIGSYLGVINTIYIGYLLAALASLWIVFGPVIKVKKQPEVSHQIKHSQEEKT